MAAAKPPNIVSPRNLKKLSSSSQQVPFNLPEETKRQVAVGIALMNILLPELKILIDAKLSKLYEHLKRNYAIDTPNNSLMYPSKEHGFDYREPKNDPKNYVINDRHDMAKLFLQKNMAHFTAITDGSFDCSAALNIIEKAKCSSSCNSAAPLCSSANTCNCSASPCTSNQDFCFTPKQKCLARLLRQDVRNPWGHFNPSVWDSTQYLTSFKLMNTMVSALPNNFAIIDIINKIHGRLTV